MATLQRIRNHGLFLLIIVGLAMLAFILGDALNSGSSFLNKSREYIGEIEGQKIHYTEYENAVEQLTEVYKIESGRNDFDEDMHAQIRNQVWQMMVAKYTLQSEAEKIGMDVTADELYELCAGATPHQLITSRRMFAVSSTATICSISFPQSRWIQRTPSSRLTSSRLKAIGCTGRTLFVSQQNRRNMQVCSRTY